MEQRVLNTRTVRTIGEGGLESFTTVVLDSLHYESHLICTNCGPLGLKADVEPNTNRAALSDRSWAHIVHSTDDHETGDVDFDVESCSEALKAQINRYRVCACLVAYVLIFTKHIPACKPNLAYASMLCNKWNEILWLEYNLPRPSKRKKIKLRMMLELFAVESAVFEKFMISESAVDFADMRPDANGNMSPFCIAQLVDVVRSLQRCLDHEVILNAWSHSLDHSPATSSHVFQMKTVLAQLHGAELDRRVLVGDPGATPAPQAPPATPTPAHQGRGPEPDLGGASSNVLDDDDETLQFMQDDWVQFNAERDAQVAAQDPASAPAISSAPLGIDPDPDPEFESEPPTPPPPNQAAGVAPRTGTPPNWNQRHSEPLGQTTDERGRANNTGPVVTRPVMDDGMTRQRAAETAQELAITRELRCELSNRALTKKIAREGTGAHQQLTKLFTDCVGEGDREPKHRMTSTGAVISAKRAAGACMPNAADLLDHGIEEVFLKNIACGMASKVLYEDGAKIGIGLNRWEYEGLPCEIELKGPASFDFNWARLSSFTKSAGAEVVATGATKQKSIWTNSARAVRSASSSGIFSLLAEFSVTLETLRDVLFMIAWSPVENKIRIPKKIPTFRWQSKNPDGCNGHRFNIDDQHMLSGGYGFNDGKKGMDIHPKNMYHQIKPGVYDMSRLDPAFASPVDMERPVNSQVGHSLGQKRLDHLTNNRALPVCITPEGFERGVPIKECEAFNGIYFNKHTASEQSALVLEMGLYLANVPGIVGGKYSVVPDSFKADPNPGRERDRHEAELEQTRQEQAGAAAAAMDGAHRPHVPVVMREDDFEIAADGEDQAVEAEDCDFAEQEESPPMDDDTHADHESVQRSVTHPEEDAADVRPEPGATDRAAQASIDPGAMVSTLPYEWDQLAMFFTLRMSETLHNDVHAHVDKYRARFADVYGDEEREETLAGLPQITLRFPGVVDLKGKNETRQEEKTPLLQPLSCSVPLHKSRYCDVAKQIKSTRGSRGLTEAVHSFAHGRAIAFNDPEVLEQEAEARGIDAGISMEGNLFARSTWQRFTLSALDSRGMRTPEEEVRVADQGLCMRLRVRNKLGVLGAGGDPLLDGCSEAKAHTFAARQRQKRKLPHGAEEEGDEVIMESLNCKRRSLEREREREMVDDSMDLEPSV